MPLPPMGDPQRPLHLAVRSARVLGVIFTLVGVLVCFLIVSLMNRGGMGTLMIAAVVVLTYLLPGVAYLFVAVYLKRRAKWAVTTGLVVSSLHGLLALFAVLTGLAGLVSSGDADRPSSFVSLALSLAWVAAIAQLIYHLSLSYEAIRVGEMGERGFEPVVQPVAPYGPPPHERPEVLTPDAGDSH